MIFFSGPRVKAQFLLIYRSIRRGEERRSQAVGVTLAARSPTANLWTPGLTIAGFGVATIFLGVAIVVLHPSQARRERLCF
jgi:hypothetical protein